MAITMVCVFEHIVVAMEAGDNKAANSKTIMAAKWVELSNWYV